MRTEEEVKKLTRLLTYQIQMETQSKELINNPVALDNKEDNINSCADQLNVLYWVLGEDYGNREVSTNAKM